MIYAISCLSMKRHSAIFTFPSLAKLAVSLRAWTQLSILRNATPTDVISQYDYTYDAAGRRIEIARSGTAMSESRTDAYGYNVRNELTSATKTGGPASPEYAYQYDDIGNRITSTDITTNRTYTANSLNQYSAIMTSDSGLQPSSFTPQYDDDGNQTLIRTSTGVWSVQYNGENRPVLWTGGTQSAATNIVMSFDRMGRRVAKNYQRFVYDDYLQIADNSGNTFVWDCMETVATRPLARSRTGAMEWYSLDGNKSVSEIVTKNCGVVAHYGYAPFGAVVVQSGTSASTNPWRFSSEFTDDDTKTIYYIFRCYEPVEGRWLNRDAIEEHGGLNLYENVGNDPIGRVDRRGLTGKRCIRIVGRIMDNQNGDYAKYKEILDAKARSLRKEGKDTSPCSVKVSCECCLGIRQWHTSGLYQAPEKKESSGEIVICKNVLANMNLSDYDYEKKATEVLNHEMLHAVQECYSENFDTPCEKSICREINSYYNANTVDNRIYRCEKERKDRVWDGVLTSSSFFCAPATAPKVSKKQEESMRKTFERLYEKCKNKWPRKDKRKGG